MNVATHVTRSNCLAASIGSARSTNVHAASIVARNAIDQYKAHIGSGEKIAANVANAPYTMRRRDGAFPGKWSLLRRRRRKAATGSTTNGRTARIKSCQSPALFGDPIFQNPVFRLTQRHSQSISTDAGALQKPEDRIEVEREKAISFLG
jgi:hypothetical protein